MAFKITHSPYYLRIPYPKFVPKILCIGCNEYVDGDRFYQIFYNDQEVERVCDSCAIEENYRECPDCKKLKRIKEFYGDFWDNAQGTHVYKKTPHCKSCDKNYAKAL